jgi:hypothetical protein
MAILVVDTAAFPATTGTVLSPNVALYEGALPVPSRCHGRKRTPANSLQSVAEGRIAQLVEQLTLNQRVPGSSPGAPTKNFRRAIIALAWRTCHRT